MAKGKLPLIITAMKIAGSISNGIGKNAQNIPMAMPLAVDWRLNVHSSGCFKLSPKICKYLNSEICFGVGRYFRRFLKIFTSLIHKLIGDVAAETDEFIVIGA